MTLNIFDFVRTIQLVSRRELVRDGEISLRQSNFRRMQLLDKTKEASRTGSAAGTASGVEPAGLRHRSGRRPGFQLAPPSDGVYTVSEV